MSARNDGRNPQGNVPLSYDRPHPLIRGDRRTPSPGPSAGYPYYDRYEPPTAEPIYRDAYTNGYGADSWRPEPSWYNRSPSPERYHPARPFQQADDWDTRPWPLPEPDAWSDRRPLPEPVYDNSWPGVQRDTMAERMFEPSESWKQAHNEDSYPDKERSYDHYQGSPIRPMRPRTPPYRPPTGDHYSPPPFDGDHYRPLPPSPPPRVQYPPMNPRSDCYRPQYDDDGWNVPSPEASYSTYEPPPLEQNFPRVGRMTDVQYNNFDDRQRSVSSVSSRSKPFSPMGPPMNRFNRGPKSNFRNVNATFLPGPNFGQSQPGGSVELMPQRDLDVDTNRRTRRGRRKPKRLHAQGASHDGPQTYPRENSVAASITQSNLDSIASSPRPSVEEFHPSVPITKQEEDHLASSWDAWANWTPEREREAEKEKLDATVVDTNEMTQIKQVESPPPPRLQTTLDHSRVEDGSMVADLQPELGPPIARDVERRSEPEEELDRRFEGMVVSYEARLHRLPPPRFVPASSTQRQRPRLASPPRFVRASTSQSQASVGDDLKQEELIISEFDPSPVKSKSPMSSDVSPAKPASIPDASSAEPTVAADTPAPNAPVADEPPPPSPDQLTKATKDDDGGVSDVDSLYAGERESPRAVATAESNEEAPYDSDMDMSPPPTPRSPSIPLELPDTPRTSLGEGAPLSPGLYGDKIDIKAERVPSSKPAESHSELLDVKPLPASYAEPYLDDSDMEMSPPASPVLRSPSAESATVVASELLAVQDEPISEVVVSPLRQTQQPPLDKFTAAEKDEKRAEFMHFSPSLPSLDADVLDVLPGITDSVDLQPRLETLPEPATTPTGKDILNQEIVDNDVPIEEATPTSVVVRHHTEERQDAVPDDLASKNSVNTQTLEHQDMVLDEPLLADPSADPLFGQLCAAPSSSVPEPREVILDEPLPTEALPSYTNKDYLAPVEPVNEADDASIADVEQALDPPADASFDTSLLPSPADASKETSDGDERWTMERPDSAMQVDHADLDAHEVRPLSEALRMVVKTRLRYDYQTREERVEPVLSSNLAIAEAPRSQAVSPRAVAQEVVNERIAQEHTASVTKQSLQARFAQRQAALSEKVQHLREEYVSLHRRWREHCAKLDEVAKASALEEAAATAGRTTRRSTALGDAVRSDLEMEQIIASLGNEELTDANHLAARNAATIPDMISVIRGSVDYLYDDSNNIVDDPINFYAPNTGLDDWSEEERQIFLEKFAAHPKQFGIIADYLPNKTAAQCVTYYYLHKKTFIDFRKVVSKHMAGKRRRGGRRAANKQKGNALLTDIRQHDDEVSRDSTPDGRPTRRRRGATSQSAELRRTGTRRTASQRDTSPTPTSTPDPEPEAKRRRRRVNLTARAVAAMEQEVGMEQEADDDAQDSNPKPAKRGRKSRKPRSTAVLDPSPTLEDTPMASSETKFIDQTDMTSRKKPPLGNTNWSDEDKSLFLKLLAQHGDDFKRIAASMPNKTTIQVSLYYKANQEDLELDKVAAKAPKRSPTPEITQPDIWQEASFPPSGVLTPSGTSTTSGDAVGMEAPFLNPPRRIQIKEVKTSADREALLRKHVRRPTPPGPGEYHFHAATVETMRAHYNGRIEESPHSFDRVLPRPLHSDGPLSQPLDNGHHDSHLPGFTPAASTLTMTFPSKFAYTNLSPSHFTGERLPPQRNGASRGVTPPGVPSSSTMTFDSSMLLQQTPWLAPPMPVALQTTEDLAAYLEHRTRLAGQNMEYSDF